MLDHVTLRVPDRAAAEAFYEAVLTPLGVDATFSGRTVATWHEFGVAQADPGHPPTTGVHAVFAAPSREQVTSFWEAGEGGTRQAAPRELDGGRFAAVLVDAAGNLAEARHDPHASPRHGIVADLRVTVADLTATTAFLHAIAPAAGLTGHPAAPGEKLVTGRGGGSLTFVAGSPPTAHLHIAFPGSEDEVRRFHADALAAGFRDNGAPGERPQYHDGYFAAYVLDPDGTNVEVVSHGLT